MFHVIHNKNQNIEILPSLKEQILWSQCLRNLLYLVQFFVEFVFLSSYNILTLPCKWIALWKFV